MKKTYFIVLITLSFQSCFYVGKDRYEDIIQKQSIDWSIRDGLTVLISPMVHNFFDLNSPNIKVIATPYFPSVVLSIERSEQRIKHWNENEFRNNVDELLKAATGLYMDWDGYKFVDSKGNYFRSKTQIDSLLFLITIENRSFPCNVPLQTVAIGQGYYQMVPLMQPCDWPCYLPDITNLPDRILLINDKNKFIKPKYVWGVRHNILTQPETLLAMFYFRQDEYHFLDGSDSMVLLVTGFDAEIKLAFDLSKMK